MSKEQMRQRLRNLSFTEKIRILEKLRDRSLAFAAAGSRAHERLERLLLSSKSATRPAAKRRNRKARDVSPGN